MKRKNKTLLLILVVLSLLIIFLLPSILFGEVYDNIGFKKDVPEEIRKACPMCYEFLDVKWIDEKRYIGKLKTEWYKDGKKQGSLYLLVKLEEPGSDEMFRRGYSIIYDITEQEYYSKSFEQFIKGANLTYGKGFFLMFAEKGKQVRKYSQNIMPFYPLPVPMVGYRDYSTKTYANFSKTICVLYPRNGYVFVAETKKPFMKDSLSEELKGKYDTLLKFANDRCNDIQRKCVLDYIKYCNAIDVNYDGMDDYVFQFNPLIGKGKGAAIEYILFSKHDNYEFRKIPKWFDKYYKPFFYALTGRKGVCYVTCDLTQVTEGGN